MPQFCLGYDTMSNMPTNDRGFDRYRELAARVGELRPNLIGYENAIGYLAIFDEFVRECERGLAVHTVCDYLLEPGTPRPETTVIERIQELHLSMKLDDDCVHRLHEK
jgi:hypothetical protein